MNLKNPPSIEISIPPEVAITRTHAFLDEHRFFLEDEDLRALERLVMEVANDRWTGHLLGPKTDAAMKGWFSMLNAYLAQLDATVELQGWVSHVPPGRWKLGSQILFSGYADRRQVRCSCDCHQ